MFKQSDKDKLDNLLTRNFRFFSIIDKNVRQAIYKHCELDFYKNKGTMVEEDVDLTKYLYVVL